MTLIRLPAYRLRLASIGAPAAGGVWVWHGSAWKVDRTERLGAERSVFAYWTAMCGRPAPQARAWTTLYFRVRGATGWPVTIDRVPANLLHDVRTNAVVFDHLAAASWCAACHAAPALPSYWLCAWCQRAPVAEAFTEPPTPEWLAEGAA